MNARYIKELRSFNRFYTNVIGLLDRYLLNSQYTLPEVRVLYELYHAKALTASDIIDRIDIDKGYLSRILKKLEKDQLISKANISSDRRASTLQLNAKGRKEFQQLDNASDQQVAAIFKHLSVKECDALIRKTKEIQQLITKSLRYEQG